MKLYFGSMHARPDTLPVNTMLKERGSKWRVSTCKSVGLHTFNIDTQVYLAIDDEGYLRIPDLPDKP